MNLEDKILSNNIIEEFKHYLFKRDAINHYLTNNKFWSNDYIESFICKYNFHKKTYKHPLFLALQIVSLTFSNKTRWMLNRTCVLFYSLTKINECWPFRLLRQWYIQNQGYYNHKVYSTCLLGFEKAIKICFKIT